MTRLTRDVRKKVILGFRAGASDSDVARIASVDPELLFHWIATRPDFRREVDAARNANRILAASTIRQAVMADWRAAQAFLHSEAQDAELDRLRELTTDG